MQYAEAEKFILEKLRRELPSNLYYHGAHHTVDVIESAERLAGMENINGADLFILKSAALFHDAGFIYQYNDNEPLGAKMAGDILPSYGFSSSHISEIKKLILATALPHSPASLLEKILIDADLDYLGREDFYSISHSLRREWTEQGKGKTLPQWYKLQLEFLKGHSYFTASADTIRGHKKKQYIREIAELTGNPEPDPTPGNSTGPLQPANEILDTLRKASIFNAIDDAILSDIAGMMRPVAQSSGDQIISKGDMGNFMYIIHSGKVKVHDDTITIAELGPGEFFGEVSLLDTEPRSASVTAVEKTVLLSLDQDAFYRILQNHREVAQGIMKTLIGRFRKQNAVIINQSKEKEKKLSALVDQRTRELQYANKAVEKSLKEIGEKNQKLEIAYKDIRDSISYARKIQQAILPSIQDIKQSLPESFVYYRPKDIVSGDFYFFAEKDDKKLIGVADCTGHGVPGAFMSMIGHDMLNQIIMEKGITRPDKVLNLLESSIRNALKQDAEDSEAKDGMDIALCSLQHNGNDTELNYSGAFRNLYVLRKNAKEVEEIRADKNSIGGMLMGESKKFSNHGLSLHKGDMFYIFSDGYCDQFGGPGGKKFMSRQFQKLLLNIRNLDMVHQESEIDRTFNEWRGKLEQVDDVLVIGVRI